MQRETSFQPNENKIEEIYFSNQLLFIWVLIGGVMSFAGLDLFFFHYLLPPLAKDTSNTAKIIISLFSIVGAMAALDAFRRILFPSAVIIATTKGLWLDITLGKKYFLPWKELIKAQEQILTNHSLGQLRRTPINKTAPIKCLSLEITPEAAKQLPLFLKSPAVVDHDYTGNDRINLLESLLSKPARELAQKINSWQSTFRNS